MSEYEAASLFQRIQKGLEESVAYSRGELTLKTTTLPLPPPPASPKRVAALRRKLKMSQSVFAATLNVSSKLVQSWEQGSRKPSRADLRLIQIIEKEPRLIKYLFAAARAGHKTSTHAARQLPGRRRRAVA
jgi:putative transcriptional regulator